MEVEKKERKSTKIQIRKEEVKQLPLLADNKTLYTENPKKSTKNYQN